MKSGYNVSKTKICFILFVMEVESNVHVYIFVVFALIQSEKTPNVSTHYSELNCLPVFVIFTYWYFCIINNNHFVYFV